MGGDGLFSLLECQPLTGRTHQIRAHLAWRGHPLIADATYNSRGQARRQFTWCPRLWLHCAQMRVVDLAGRPFEITTSLPSDLCRVLERELIPEGASVNATPAVAECLPH